MSGSFAPSIWHCNQQRGIDDALDGRQHHRHMLRQTTRHRAVGDDVFHGGDAITGKHTTDFGGEHRTNDWRTTRAE